MRPNTPPSKNTGSNKPTGNGNATHKIVITNLKGKKKNIFGDKWMGRYLNTTLTSGSGDVDSECTPNPSSTYVRGEIKSATIHTSIYCLLTRSE
jgi:hypothetical protein